MNLQVFFTKYTEILAASSFIPKTEKNDGWILSLEKHLLIKHFKFLDVNIINNKLKCTGFCRPSDHSRLYTYQIQFTPDRSPNVFVKDPVIKYHRDIHMYPKDNSLCLYYPRDYSWTKTSHLYNTIIPWTHEWFVFYELYQIYGKWLHPSVDHGENLKLKDYGF